MGSLGLSSGAPLLESREEEAPLGAFCFPSFSLFASLSCLHLSVALGTP